MATTVLIVDDHADFRAFARTLLQAEGFEVVGEAPDGATALARARELKPQIVLLDVQLPDMDGFAVCEQLVAHEDAPAVVLTSTRTASSYGAGSFSPDGKKIVYINNSTGGFQVYAINLDGSGVTRLTNATDPDWANWGPIAG